MDFAPNWECGIMLDVTNEDIRSLDNGVVPTQKVVIYWSNGAETYTEEDYLKRDGANTSYTHVSDESKYELNNMSVVLINRDNFFSRFFIREVPNGQKAVVYDVLNGRDIERFNGKLSYRDWFLTPQEVNLTIIS